jgi:hypothetical protein
MAAACPRSDEPSSDGPPINDAEKPQRIRAALPMPASADLPMLEAMTARAVQQLEARLDDLRRVGWARLGTAAAAALLAAPAHMLDPALSIALAAGSCVVAMLAIRAFVDRCDLIDSVAADRDALAVAAVRARAERIAAPQELARAAAMLRQLADRESDSRLVACRPELLELADTLSTAPPERSVAVACVRFVETSQSALFDVRVTGVELRSELRHLLALARSAQPQRGSAPLPIPLDGSRANLTSR